MNLTGKQRKHLRGLAHKLSPVVQIGKNGITDDLVAEVRVQLAHHELIKAKFVDFKDDRDELSEELAKRTEAKNVGTIGHIAIFYRRQDNEAKRKIAMPGVPLKPSAHERSEKTSRGRATSAQKKSGRARSAPTRRRSAKGRSGQ